MANHRFTEGSTHENEKGPFRVLKIQGDSMVIEWDSGETVTTPVALQEKIQERMEREVREQTTGKSRKTPVWMGRSFSGLAATDFKDDVTGTHWRSREQLGGAVAKLLHAKEPVNSWSIYRRPEIHWAAVRRYPMEVAWVQAKFFFRLDEASASFGFYVERSSKRGESRADWLNFVNWIGNESHVAWLHRTLQSTGLNMADPYGGPEQALNRTIAPAPLGWLVTFTDGRTENISLTSLSEYLAAVPDKHWLNIVIGHRVPAADLVAQGHGAASTVAACFNLLLPLYENRAP